MSAKIPDSVIMASIRGTCEVPQIYCAATMCIGASITRLVIGRKMSWEDVRRGEITDEQAVKVGRALNAVHEQQGIPARFDPKRPQGTTDEERAKGAPILVSMDSLRTVTRNGIHKATNASGMFALLSTPELEPFAPSLEQIARQSIVETSVPLLTELFTNPAHAPKVKALQMLWDRSEALLRERNFLTQAGDYRKGVTKHQGSDRYREHRRSMERRTHRALKTRLGALAFRQEIQRYADGYVPPVPVIDEFAVAACRYVVTDLD